ncbi:MAG: DUF192 domain-containing protein [Acidobacteria bacterium]|nr:DUF192 domain-containing protein [Acidobacteriota bacterium]
MLASAVEIADTRTARRRGLLGQDAIDPASALIIAPCWAVHTAFMRFAIDVLFVDAEGVVMKVAGPLPPWRAAFARGAYAAVELAAGAAALRRVQAGDRLYVRSSDGPATPSALPGSASFFRMAAKPACSGS